MIRFTMASRSIASDIAWRTRGSFIGLPPLSDLTKGLLSRATSSWK